MRYADDAIKRVSMCVCKMVRLCTGMRSDDGNGRRADVRGRRQLVVLLEAARRNADGRASGSVRPTAGGVCAGRRFRLTGQLPRLLRRLRG